MQGKVVSQYRVLSGSAGCPLLPVGVVVHKALGWHVQVAQGSVGSGSCVNLKITAEKEWWGQRGGEGTNPGAGIGRTD